MDVLVEPYLSIREDIQTCDIGLASGSNLLSTAIKGALDSPYSHAFMFRRDYNRVMVYEAAGNGTICKPASHLAERKYEFIDIYRITQLDKDKSLKYLLDNLGCHYDFGVYDDVWWAKKFPHIYEIFNKEEIDNIGLDAFICSAYIQGACLASGIDHAIDIPTRRTTPDILAHFPSVFWKRIKI